MQERIAALLLLADRSPCYSVLHSLYFVLFSTARVLAPCCSVLYPLYFLLLAQLACSRLVAPPPFAPNGINCEDTRFCVPLSLYTSYFIHPRSCHFFIPLCFILYPHPCHSPHSSAVQRVLRFHIYLMFVCSFALWRAWRSTRVSAG